MLNKVIIYFSFACDSNQIWIRNFIQYGPSFLLAEKAISNLKLRVISFSHVATIFPQQPLC